MSTWSHCSDRASKSFLLSLPFSLLYVDKRTCSPNWAPAAILWLWEQPVSLRERKEAEQRNEKDLCPGWDCWVVESNQPQSLPYLKYSIHVGGSRWDILVSQPKRALTSMSHVQYKVVILSEGTKARVGVAKTSLKKRKYSFHMNFKRKRCC